MDKDKIEVNVAKPGEQIVPNKPRTFGPDLPGEITETDAGARPPVASEVTETIADENTNEVAVEPVIDSAMPEPLANETEVPPTTPSIEPAPSDATSASEPDAEPRKLADTPTSEESSEPATETANDSKPDESSTKTEPPKVVKGGESHKLRNFFVAVLIVLLLGGIGYLAWKVSNQKTTTSSTTAVIKKDVTLLRIGSVEGLVNSFYPSADDFELTAFQVNNQIYEGLVQFQNGTKIVPLLATSWTNPDDNIWIFNIKRGVKFHNGNTLTAKDVKYSLDKYAKTAFEGVFKFDTKSLTVVNDNKIKIVTASPDPLLLHKLAYLMIVDSTSTKDGDPTAGTGPYQVKPGTTPTESQLDLVAFDKYHGGRPSTREIKWTSYATEDELLKDTIAKKIDYAIAIDTAKDNDQLKRQTNLTIVSDPGIGVSAMGFNTLKKGSPLANLKVRQAIALAIDRQAVIDASNLKAVPAYQAVTQDVPGYNNDITSSKPDPEAAKKLLADAGYPKGLSFDLAFSKEFAIDQATNIAKQLKEIGVTVNLKPQDTFDQLAEIAFNGKGDAYFMSNTTDLLDASDVLTSVFKSTNYSNAKFDQLLADAGKSLDSSKRLSDLEQASKIVIVEDVAEVPIYSRTDNTAYDPSLVVNRDSYIGPYFWKVYKKG